MGLDPIYIYHCYDRMENLVAYLNDRMLFINCGLTVSEYKHDNLGILGSRDYSIFGSVDIKNIKKIFAHHKNTYLGIIF